MTPEIKYVDWNELWNDQVRRHRETQKGMDCALYWEARHRAQHYWDSVRGGQAKRIHRIIEDIGQDPAARVLDVGAGPGVLAAPLAQRVAHVTAVDPSTGMMDVLEEKIAELGIDNIKCVRKRWEDVDTDTDLERPYDYVICSFAIGGMTDIRESIEKMQRVSSRFVYIYWFASEPSWEESSRELCMALHGTCHSPMPKSEVLTNLLYQMGIYPNVKVFNYFHTDTFDTFSEAVEYYKDRYNAETELQESIIRKHVKKVSEEEAGRIVIRSEAKCLKMWWDKNRDYPTL